ncbi:MAG: hypothetical protein OEY87_08755 [Gammaproteobacteria bacterium]|nr:hypothetical protein [Gammaproteobacteria bacterium]MDH5736195.1 hypothetical protein [Gammaproteobacteria bacterium]
MATINDFTDTETWTVESTLRERWGNDNGIELQYAEADIRLNPGDREATTCPAVLWNYKGCNYIIFKTGQRKYRCQFFYRGYQQYGTGIHEYNDIGDCIISLLQVQADHARDNNMEEEKGPQRVRGQAIE